MHGADSSTRARRAHLARGVLSAALLACHSCGGDYRTIEESRELRAIPGGVIVGASSAERFGAPPSARQAPENPLTWSAPDGWREVAPRSSFRMADFEVGGDPLGECYLSILPGGGGGVLANVNRWYAQFGLAPLDSSQLAALPRFGLLGAAATYVQLEGTFTAMSGEPLADAALLGLIFEVAETPEMPGFSLFLKCTGPRGLIETERDAFLELARSVRFRGATGADQAGGDLPGGSGAAGGEAGALPPGIELAEPLPDGWRIGEQRPMRLLTLVTPAGEVGVSMAGGSLEQNVARWYGQLGLEAPEAWQLAGLPTLELQPGPATLLDLEGSFSGMGSSDIDEARMLGLICPLADGRSLFIKLVGPREAVAGEFENLIAFARSLRLESVPQGS
jgi:hypothetical protein